MPLALEGHPVAVEHIVPASCMRALCRPPHKVNSLLFLHELLFLSPPRVETHVRANPRRSLPPSRSLARPRAPRSRPAAGPASSGLSLRLELWPHQTGPETNPSTGLIVSRAATSPT